MKPKITRCPTCGRKARRSTPANARYWVLLHAISEGVPVQGKHHSSEVWHTYFKSKFLGCEEVTLPNGKTMQFPHSSAELDTAEFADFMMKVELWAGEHGVWLEMETA